MRPLGLLDLYHLFLGGIYPITQGLFCVFNKQFKGVISMLTKLLLAAGIGSIMGLMTHAKRNKTIKKPRNSKRTFYPGFILDMGYGAVAALAVVIVADPNGIERLILTSILGGYAGDSVIAKLEAANQQHNLELLKKVMAEENSDLTGIQGQQENKNKQ
jgi:hypothetical protein